MPGCPLDAVVVGVPAWGGAAVEVLVGRAELVMGGAAIVDAERVCAGAEREGAGRLERLERGILIASSEENDDESQRERQNFLLAKKSRPDTQQSHTQSHPSPDFQLLSENKRN